MLINYVRANGITKVLFYFRGGKKESLIEEAEGAGEIKTLLNSFNME